MAVSCCKLLELAVNGCRWLEMTGNGRKWLEWHEMALHGWKLLEWLQMARNGWKWLESAGVHFFSLWWDGESSLCNQDFCLSRHNNSRKSGDFKYSQFIHDIV